MKLWLNFQESLAAATDPSALSQESWCVHIREEGESVSEAYGKEHLQAQRSEWLLRGWDRLLCNADANCGTGSPAKGTAEMDVSLTKTKPLWHFTHSHSELSGDEL